VILIAVRFLDEKKLRCDGVGQHWLISWADKCSIGLCK
jgi:hypothetical protein